MKLDFEFTCGQVRAQGKAGRGRGQWVADVIVTGAARPFKLIARVVLDDASSFGSKRGRIRDGWRFAQVIGQRRVVMLAYRPDTGLPVRPELLGAPAYRWWPQHVAAGTAREDDRRTR